MALMLAPYNEAMRLGMGFNSYTQQLCVNDVVRKPGGIKVTDSDIRAYAPEPGSQNAVSSSASDAAILSDPTGTGTAVVQKKRKKDGQSEVSQVVSWEAGFIDRISEVTDSLNISGSLAITVDALGGGAGGSGNYMNSSALKKSDATYKVTVKVTNQRLIPENMTEFSPIPNVPASMFNDVYGDSFISGFIEGGVFNALVMKELENTTEKKKMGGSLSVKLKLAGVGSVDGEAKGNKIDDSVQERHSTTIDVSWSGGGDIKPNDIEDWDIPSLVKVAMEFPDRVAACPQKTYAILTKYSSLRSFHEQSVKGSPLDYENAGLYTATLLDAYMDYKTMWKDLQQMTTELEHGLIQIEARQSSKNLVSYAENFSTDYSKRLEKYKAAEKSLIATARGQTQITLEEPLPPNSLEPYDADIFGLEKAKSDCRFEMIKIVRETNEVSLNPKVSTDPYRLWRFLSPNIFRLLLPKSTNTAVRKTLEEIDDLKQKMEDAIREHSVINTEAERLKNENEQLKQQVSEETSKLKTENEQIKQQGSEETNKMKTENEQLKQQVSEETLKVEELKEKMRVFSLDAGEQLRTASDKIGELESRRWEAERRSLVWGGRPEAWRTGRIQIHFMLYGGEVIWDDDAARRMIRYIETNEEFAFNDPIFGRDPRPGIQKSGAILYRFDDAGEMRCLVRKQHEPARFDPLP